MENRPEKPTPTRKRKHSGTNIYHRLLTLLFSVFVLVIAYVVYKAVNQGIGLPVSSVGQPAPNDQIYVQEHDRLSQPSEEQSTQPSTTERTEPTEPSVTEPTEPDEPIEPQELAQSYLADMSLEDKIWQMMIVSSDRLLAVDGSQYPVGGVYYAPENLTDAQALADDMFAVQATAKTPVMFGVMHEGGSRSPLTDLDLAEIVGTMRSYGDTGDTDEMYTISLHMGEQIRAAGFHFNLAPVADTYTGLNGWIPAAVYDMENRTFGTLEDISSGLLQSMVSQSVKGMQAGGTITCLKHFPNLGSSGPTDEGDTSWRGQQTFEAEDFKPFEAGIEAGAQMVMVSNMNAPYLTNGFNIPCCRAKEVVTDILRNRLGFEGVILTDDQSTQTNAANIVATVQAGCDMIYLPADAQAAVNAIMEAVQNGTLSETQIDESVYRILLMKCENGIITE